MHEKSFSKGVKAAFEVLLREANDTDDDALNRHFLRIAENIAELDTSEYGGNTFAKELEEKQAEIDELKEALKPFAEFIEGTDPSWADQRRVSTLSYDFTKLKLGLFRKARKALGMK